LSAAQPESLLGRRNRALILLGFDSACRRGELGAKTGHKSLPMIRRYMWLGSLFSGNAAARARQRMTIFVPRGSTEDPTRSPAFYDQALEDPVALELLDLALGEPPAIVDAGLSGLAAREVASATRSRHRLMVRSWIRYSSGSCAGSDMAILGTAADARQAARSSVARCPGYWE
jgi:hypothetical protein